MLNNLFTYVINNMKTRKHGGIPTKNSDIVSIFKTNGRFSSKKNQKIPLQKKRISFNPDVINSTLPRPAKFLTSEEREKIYNSEKTNRQSLKEENKKKNFLPKRDICYKLQEVFEKELRSLNPNDPNQADRIETLKNKIDQCTIRSKNIGRDSKFLDPNYKNLKKQESYLCAKKIRQEVEGERVAPQGIFSSCTISGGRKTRIKRKLRKRKSTNQRF